MPLISAKESEKARKFGQNSLNGLKISEGVEI